MKNVRLVGVAALLAAGLTQAQAQEVKFNGALLEVWATQMLDNNLRNNSTATHSPAYYEGLSGGRFQENGFYLKRAEFYFGGKLTDDVSWAAMFDPNNANTTTTPNAVLHDAVITWSLSKNLSLRVGQFKMPTTYEATMVAAKDILFFDRNQLNRQFGDKRDRGIWMTYGYGDAKGFNAKLNLAISNGNTDDGTGGKNNSELNAQKDYTFRFEGAYGPDHKFGFYYREGVTNLKSSTMNASAIPAAWTVGQPNATQIKDNNDKTTLQGIYYAFDNATWHADAEVATGTLGRRFPTLFAAAGTNPSREHLDQKFLGYAVTGVYKMGRHWFLARYDVLNYNSGDDWYTATNPYKTATADYSPKFTEAVIGYNFLFNPTKSALGKVKLDYIHRSKNFLAPRAGQTGEQGGDSLVASLMVAF